MMSGESLKPARVLAEFSDEVAHMLEKIIKLIQPQFQGIVADVLQLVPKEILSRIIASERDSNIRIIEYIDEMGGHTKHIRFASWIRRQLIPDCLIGVNWKEIMGELRDQEDHDVCWAIVVSELIRVMRLLDRRETDPNVRYSPQDLIDFADPVKRSQLQKAGQREEWEYVMKNGIQREEDRPFQGCPQEIPQRTPSCFGYIKEFVRIQILKDALLQVRHHPIGAGVAMFQPEYRQIGKKIYRGPVNRFSHFVGLHAISIMAAGEDENGEKYALVRASHGERFGDGGYVKVSLEVMLAYIPTPGEAIDTTAQKQFSTPSPLLCRFSYPKLLPREEEAKLKQSKLPDHVSIS